MSTARRDCGCCHGTGLVEAHTGDMRPCSRCRVEDFHTWYDDLVKTTAARKAEQAGAA